MSSDNRTDIRAFSERISKEPIPRLVNSGFASQRSHAYIRIRLKEVRSKRVTNLVKFHAVSELSRQGRNRLAEKRIN